MARLALGLIAAALVLSSARSVRALPQWNAGIAASGCTRGHGDELVSGVAFCGGAGGDVLFGRERERDFGAGPYLALSTAAFDDIRFAGGGRVLLPIVEDFPVVVSGGGLITGSGAPGFDTSLFWGLRSYNFHGSYNFAGGIVGGVQRTFGEQATTVFSVGLQIDALVIAAPFMLAWGAFQ